MNFYVYALKGCPYSEEAVNLLQQHPHIKCTVKWVERGSEADALKEKNKHPTFPQIFFEYKVKNKNRRVFIGGCDKLKELLTLCKDLKKCKLPLSATVYTTRMLEKEES